MNKINSTTVREYSEEMAVEIKRLKTGDEYKPSEQHKEGYDNQRYVVKAYNEAGYNCTEVDILDLITYIKSNIPELFNEIKLINRS